MLWLEEGHFTIKIIKKIILQLIVREVVVGMWIKRWGKPAKSLRSK